MKYLIKAVLGLVHLLTFGQLKYSRPVEGNALYMSAGEKFWWGYKFFGHPIKEPERGKGIREHFQANPPEGFTGVGESESAVEGLPSITLGLAGDILPCPDLHNNPPKLLGDAIDFFGAADIRCANLESPVFAAKPLCAPTDDITAPPEMNNSPEALALLLQKAGQSNGLTVLTTANNHSMDQGVEGLVATLDLLDELQVLHVGTARSTEERDALLLVDVQGFKLAFLSWTYSLNNKSLSDGQGHLANTLRLNLPDVDLSPITAQVAEARQRGADFVILCLHWGLENEKFPLASQIEKAHRLCESGVDIICGNHPHTTQPAERYTWVEQQGDREVQRESLILYALGDFISPLAHLNLSSVTNMVETLLVRGVDGRVVIQDVTIKPLYAC